MKIVSSSKILEEFCSENCFDLKFWFSIRFFLKNTRTDEFHFLGTARKMLLGLEQSTKMRIGLSKINPQKTNHSQFHRPKTCFFLMKIVSSSEILEEFCIEN